MPITGARNYDINKKDCSNPLRNRRILNSDCRNLDLYACSCFYRERWIKCIAETVLACQGNRFWCGHSPATKDKRCWKTESPSSRFVKNLNLCFWRPLSIFSQTKQHVVPSFRFIMN